jgi:DNA adenine methylase
MGNVKRPILRYHGGKWRLAPWIISNFPKHRIYTEVFGGAASVLMRKRRSYAEIYNDKWGVVVNVFKVLRDKNAAKELERVLRLTPYSRDEFMLCGDACLEGLDPIEKARRTILRSMAGFGSAATNAEHSTGFRANCNRSGTTPAHDWVNYPKHIQSFTERLMGVVIENKHYQSVIDQQDYATALHYVDPPYVLETRNIRRGNAYYAHEMSDNDHRELASFLHTVKGMVVVSGYDNKLYDEIFSDWRKVHKKARADGSGERIETLWLNQLAVDNQRQMSMF